MIRLEFAPTDLAGVRFAHSPLAEVAASSVALRKPDQFWMYASWRAQVQPAVRASRLSTFLTVMAGPNGWMPDFLTPVPATARPRLREELAVVAATPLDQVAEEINRTWAGHDAPPEITRFAKDPAGGLAVLLRETRQYFDLAIAPYWPRLRAAAEAEITQRARSAAEHGPRALVRGLHPTLDWDESALSFGEGTTIDDHGLDGQGLALLPSGFAGPKVFALTDSAQGRALWYPPRGYGALWERPATTDTGGGPLAALLGPTRAAVLTLLAAPHSTGEVAEVLGLAPATASFHLTTLRDAGLITGSREGRKLRYLQTGLGEQLGGKS